MDVITDDNRTKRCDGQFEELVSDGLIQVKIECELL